MNRLIKKGSQLIIATNSPILLAYPGATIYSCGDDGVKRVAYEETEHFRITTAFLNKREKMLDILFNEGQGELF